MLSRKMETSATLLIVAAALCRLIPHWPNFTPVMAIALFGGAVLASRTQAVLIPLAAMVLSDVVLGVVAGTGYMLHDTQWAVYLSVVGISLFGGLFKNQLRLKTVVLGGTTAGVFFFVVTNFAVWLSGGMYPFTLEGLGACYVAGLAFYRDGGNFLLNGIASTLLYGGLLFSAVSVAGRVELARTRT